MRVVARMRFQLTARTGHPDFLDLPWDQPLEEWETPRITAVPRGIHRHVVRFVEYGDATYALKELPKHYALREYEALRYLADEDLPVVEAVGVVRDRRGQDGEPLDPILITRYLEYSLPYRLLFVREAPAALRDRMVDALVNLLVRLHLAGFLWLDCSLSNTLFRRDAGLLAAYLVDAETAEIHPELSGGQRSYDIDCAIERCAGELYDLIASGMLPEELDVWGLGEELRRRYEALWDELTRDEVFCRDEQHRIHERLRRINDLGYDVSEIELEGEGDELRMKVRTRLVDPGRHRRRLQELTGLDVQDNQARRLLHDIANFGAWLSREKGREFTEKQVALRWMDMSFESAMERVPQGFRSKREPAEIFHEVLEHWYYQSQIEGKDMQFHDAVDSYVDNVLPAVPDEQRLDAEVIGADAVELVDADSEE